MPEATVIIAAWCAEKTLERCVESALAQVGIDLEVVVVDDASPDGTLACAQALADRYPNVHALSLPQNGGPSAARNAALDVAKGAWIAVLDSDDAYRPNRLRTLIDFAQSGEVDIVCDALTFVDEAGAETPSPPLAHPSDPAQAPWVLSDYVYGNQLHNGTLSLGYLKPVFRTSFLRQHGLRYDETLRNGEDFHLVLAALFVGSCVRYSPEGGYLFTRRAGSISSKLNPDHAAALDQADARFLEAHHQALSPEARQRMRVRMAQNANLATAEVAITELKALRPHRAAGVLAKRPIAIHQFFKQIYEAAAKRSARLAKR